MRIVAFISFGLEIILSIQTGKPFCDQDSELTELIRSTPGKPPAILSIYLTQRERDAKARNDVVASAARIVVGAFA